MSSWHSYSKIFNLGHRAVRDITKRPVSVEEKIDGSQFSFGVFTTPNASGESFNPPDLKVRSRGREIPLGSEDKLFAPAIQTAQRLAHANTLVPNWTYRGEVLCKPKHNTLEYGRVPDGNIILFDVNRGEEDYLTREEKEAEARRLGLMIVPELFRGMISLDNLNTLLGLESCLGKVKIEGVVLKPLEPVFGPDGKTLMAKHVSEAFKEVHQKNWKTDNPNSADILERIGTALAAPARWNKAIQRRAEAGELEDDPRDIGPLIKTIQADIHEEEEDGIKAQLYKWAKQTLLRRSVRGFPEWYKSRLMTLQFSDDSE